MKSKDGEPGRPGVSKQVGRNANLVAWNEKAGNQYSPVAVATCLIVIATPRANASKKYRALIFILLQNAGYKAG